MWSYFIVWFCIFASIQTNIFFKFLYLYSYLSFCLSNISMTIVSTRLVGSRTIARWQRAVCSPNESIERDKLLPRPHAIDKNSMLEGVNERPMTSLRIRGESIGACDARFMNNVIRATTAIMGIIRYPGLHVRQQTTRTVYVRACVSFSCVNRAHSSCFDA